MFKSRFDRIIDTTFIVLLFILIMGVPLVFTPLTRSVFEVNKLLLMRVISIVVAFLWIFRCILYKANGIEPQNSDSYNILGIRWQKIGLEIPFILWLGINILSTIYAQNFYIAIIGAYDRWEGIITIINYIFLVMMYAKLVKKSIHFQWLLGGIIFSTTLSAIYGVAQSLGFDFMNWSVDPTMRVFACINNPVHYCAYVGMVVPLGLAWLLYFSTKEQTMTVIPKWFNIVKWLIFFSTICIYYSQFLSYSRATWMGFIGAMTLFYLMATDSLIKTSSRTYLMDFFINSIGITVFYLTAIFNYHQKSIYIALGIWFFIIAYIIYSYWITDAYKENIRNRLILYVSIGLSYFVFIQDLYQLVKIPDLIISVFYLILLVFFIFLSYSVQGKGKFFLSRLVIILIFAKLQFVAISWTSMMLYFTLAISYYLLILRGNPLLFREKKFWLMTFLLIFGLVLIIPTIPSHIAKLSQQNIVAEGLKATENAETKVESYKNVAIQGTARTSMWKSAIPWIKDYWILGSGPDTVKYMYPVYRRPEYGKLEGGHNFTPDRLHNEYINTLATRGILGFSIYYGGIIIGWMCLMLWGVYRLQKTPYFYIGIGLMAGTIVYLGQVMFNFGVVATLFLFYVLMGLGMAVVYHPDYNDNK